MQLQNEYFICNLIHVLLESLTGTRDQKEVGHWLDLDESKV